MARPKGSRNAIQPTKQQQEMLQDVAESKRIDIQQIQHPKKKAALEVYYSTNGNITKTCKAVNIDRSTFYEWAKTDPLFYELIEAQKAELLDTLKDEAIRRALDKENQSDTMLIFNLKNLHPEYRPQKESIAFQSEGMKFVLTRGSS